MENGRYSVKFATPFGHGSGVVIYENGKIEGGDQGYVYYGSAQQSGDHLAANINVKRHSPSAVSVFGSLNQFQLIASGKGSEGTAMLIGTSPQVPGVEITIELKKISV